MKVRALLDSGSEINAMTPIFIAKLRLRPRRTNVGTQKIDGLALETYGMISTVFLLQNNPG